MLKFYRIVKTEKLVCLDTESNEMLECVELNKEAENPMGGGGD